jgi:membrane protease YdiL (CAAX protease family)
MLIYSEMVKEAMWIDIAVLIVLFLSTIYMKNEDIRKTYQALMLLPLLRLISLSMPLFDTTLCSLFFVYVPLAVSAAITAVHQKLTRTEVGITLRRIWLYFPLAIFIGFGLALVEYQITRPGYLIPNLGPLNLIKLTVVMVFFVGLVEEFVFRSILQTRFHKIFGAGTAILLSSILFSLMHFGYGLSYEILCTFFIGIFMGYLFYKTKSLPLIVLIHGFLNVYLFGFIPHLGSGLGLL